MLRAMSDRANGLLRKCRCGRESFESFAVLTALCLSLAACATGESRAVSAVEVPHHVALLSGDTKALNYTPWYMHRAWSPKSGTDYIRRRTINYGEGGDDAAC